jgi:hypothetical protein
VSTARTNAERREYVVEGLIAEGFDRSTAERAVDRNHVRTAGIGSVTAMAEEVVLEDERELALAYARELAARGHHRNCATRLGTGRCDCYQADEEHVLARVLLREIAIA